MNNEREFAERLCKLRCRKGVSARDMSLSLGQNASYINRIENGAALPSMTAFFYICEYLEISPRDFFDYGNDDPVLAGEVAEELKKLDYVQLGHVMNIVKDILKK
ncbi:MAG: helix-turn-helix domain-containing protein [Huintestinicola sp.]|uniref:helix-turn-helix domain-containing protein n=1 Tax=Huintestinicola sp. TaxID=2981661 RepID=UPI003F0F60F5